MSTKHTRGPWSADTVRNNDAEYGSGPDSHRGFDAYAVLDAEGRILFDSLNRDTEVSEIHEHEHELGVDAWDDRARCDLTLAAAAPDLLEALELADGLLSGANMNRTVVERKVRAAIARARGEA